MSLAASVIEVAAERGIRIAVAESLTGGALAAELVSVPGASRVFSGGIVAYDTALKRTLLGVDSQVLSASGPVAAEVAKQMARGARLACAVPRPDAVEPVPAELGVATTGVAGPDPDPQTGQPAGVVWLGLSAGERDWAIPLSLAGDRAAIRASAVHAAIAAVRDELMSGEPLPRTS